MNGMVELHKACSKHDIKPIFGCEIYLVDDHAAGKATAAGGGSTKKERNHLTLLARDDAGYRNLVSSPRSASWRAATRQADGSTSPAAGARRGDRRSDGLFASRFCQRLLR